VSRNTVKTHVRNVYSKLDVHSQQELIDLVEAT
jgi:DNA-binding CsgD family transcriptional regulator